jgi:hypothetical protein
MILREYTFQDAAISSSNGNEYDVVPGYKNELFIIVDVGGTSTSRTLIFEAQGLNGNWIAIIGTNLNDNSTATQTTGTKELWKFNITGLSKIRMRLFAVAGGNVTVKGQIVD